jgi:hypothetical protein
MYAMLVADNRIVRYMTVEELINKERSEFTNYLYDECGEIPEGGYKTIAFRSYTTKAGKKMAYLVLLDHLGQLHHVMAFPTMFMQAFAKCRPGVIVYLEVAETEEGSKFVKEFVNE